MTDPVADPADQATARISELFGEIAEFWGFTRTQGRIFGLVYMSPHPLDQTAIRTRLDISAGSASMTLASLVAWGVLQRTERAYVAETDFFALVTSVMRRRERSRVDLAIAEANAVAMLLDSGPSDPQTEHARMRIRHLLGFFRTGGMLLDALVRRSPVHAILRSLARRTALRHRESTIDA